jgi:hypothetical protein
MRWQHKVSLTEVIAVYAMHEIRKEETGTMEDIGIATSAAVTIVGIWYPTGRVVAAGLVAPYVAPFALGLTGAVIVGGVISYGIAGEQGLVDYYEFLTEPTKIPERIAESINVITEEVIQPRIEAGAHGFNWIMTGINNWAERQLEEAARRLFNPIPKFW